MSNSCHRCIDGISFTAPLPPFPQLHLCHLFRYCTCATCSSSSFSTTSSSVCCCWGVGGGGGSGRQNFVADVIVVLDDGARVCSYCNRRTNAQYEEIDSHGKTALSKN